MNNVITIQQEGITIHSLLWDLIEMTDDYIVNLGIFTKINSAVGEAFDIASDEVDPKTHTITPLFKLETEAGWGFHVKSSDGKVVKTFYILEVSNEGDIRSDQ